MDVSGISKEYPMERSVRYMECLECELFRAFMECFGLRTADIKKGQATPQ